VLGIHLSSVLLQYIPSGALFLVVGNAGVGVIFVFSFVLGFLLIT
jgi:hypothetical protein